MTHPMDKPVGATVKPKKTRKALPSLQGGAGASQMETVTYTSKVEASPTNWENLPLYAVFSLASDGSYPLIKVSKSKYADLRTGNSEWVGSGRCYRVIL